MKTNKVELLDLCDDVVTQTVYTGSAANSIESIIDMLVEYCGLDVETANCLYGLKTIAQKISQETNEIESNLHKLKTIINAED